MATLFSSRYKRESIRHITNCFRERSNLRALLIFIVDSILYFATMVTILLVRNVAGDFLLAIISGVFIARLFIIGHDACHGSFTTSSLLNKVIGRLAFLPSLTPYSLWEIGHNVAHHGFPNLKGRDYVWVPFSKAEYNSLPWRRQTLEKVYRSGYGHALYYFIELWWNKLIFPSRTHVGARRAIHLVDCLIVTAYALAVTIGIIEIPSKSLGVRLSLFSMTMLIPFIIWNILVGFVTYQQHTNPSIAWYLTRDHWVGLQPQLRNTVRPMFVLPFSKVLHNIMEHHAHHLDVKIPMYNLPEAQFCVQENFSNDVLVFKWSWAQYFECVRKCKLYDFENHRWLDFEGNVTAVASPILRDRTSDLVGVENVKGTITNY